MTSLCPRAARRAVRAPWRTAWPLLAALPLLVFSYACVAPAAVPAAPATDPAREAGLSEAHLAELRALGMPLAVPVLPEGWALRALQTDADAGGAYYALVYGRAADGACFAVSGASDGFGGPEFPIVSAGVRLASLPRAPLARLYQAADDPLATSAQNWGVGALISEFVALDGLFVTFSSTPDEGCRALSLEEGAALFATLRLL